MQKNSSDIKRTITDHGDTNAIDPECKGNAIHEAPSTPHKDEASPLEAGSAKISKAQKRREKKQLAEREREQRIKQAEVDCKGIKLISNLLFILLYLILYYIRGNIQKYNTLFTLIYTHKL